MLHLKTAKLAKWQIRLLCWSGALLWLSGVAWLYLHNFGQIAGEFGPEISPFEPWMLKIHGAVMLVALLSLGSLLVVHVWRGWAYRSQRGLGAALVAAMIVLIVSGYLLYYVGNEEARAWISIVHWVVGLVSLVVFVLHYRQGRQIRKS